MINITNQTRHNCCGCHACAQICPTKCIDMHTDDEGFKYPIADKEKCIDCNKCEKVCPIIEDQQKQQTNKNDIPITLGGWHKNAEVRKRSSSGGAFTLFAEYIINNGGIVFGAAFNEELKVNHIGIENIDELDKLRGSKYVQSNINNIYIQVKENLDKARLVLFVGTPCQCAGLESFLGKDHDNLYKCDFICHGVPSPVVFEKYKDYLEEKYKDKIVEFKFRNKERNWKPTGQQMGTYIKFNNGKIKYFMPAYKDSFMNGFLSDIYLRPSCHKCKFKKIPKLYSDITIADFWGVHKIDKQLNNKEGTSLILLNTEKGRKVFDVNKEQFTYKECKFSDAIKGNPTLLKASEASINRSKFFNDLNSRSFNYLKRKYMTALCWAFERGKKFLEKR